jgi:hypothetical protein
LAPLRGFRSGDATGADSSGQRNLARNLAAAAGMPLPVGAMN